MRTNNQPNTNEYRDAPVCRWRAVLADDLAKTALTPSEEMRFRAIAAEWRTEAMQYE